MSHPRRRPDLTRNRGNRAGLIYMRARYYDPLLGRAISEDPAKNGGNWYAYAGNNPIGMVDPDGLRQWIELGQYWIAIDPPDPAMNLQRHIHYGIGRPGQNELGAINADGTKHDKMRFRKPPSKTLGKRLAPGFARDTITAYFQANPLDCIAIFLTIMGMDHLAVQLEHFNEGL